MMMIGPQLQQVQHRSFWVVCPANWTKADAEEILTATAVEIELFGTSGPAFVCMNTHQVGKRKKELVSLGFDAVCYRFDQVRV